MSLLYPLDVRDIEAIGKSRANRSLPARVKNWMWGGFGVFAIGLIYWVMNGEWKALGIMAIGAIVVWYSVILGDKWRKIVINDLKREWHEDIDRQGADRP